MSVKVAEKVLVIGRGTAFRSSPTHSFQSWIIAPPPMVVMGRKTGPRDMRPVDPMMGRVLNLEKLDAGNQQESGEDEDNIE